MDINDYEKAAYGGEYLELKPECICGRGDWIYDAEVGQWCCGCGYVKHATGIGFKEWGWTLDTNRRVTKPTP